MSICIPTYNRCKELERLLISVPLIKNIELVIVDDGSEDDTKNLVSKFKKDLNINYISQANKGRSWALHNAISKAIGSYTLLMDSDDYFIPQALEIVIENIEKNQHKFKAFACGTSIKNSSRIIKNIPFNEVSNFTELKADKKIKLDLKEIVFTTLLKENNYMPGNKCRRVPTQLLWAKVAESVDCLCIPISLAVKEYLPGGMTDNIFKLKMNNIEPMVKLYKLLSLSKKYKSKYYRLKYNLLFFRYSFHYKKLNDLKIWQLIFIPLGFLYYCFDKIRLNLI